MARRKGQPNPPFMSGVPELLVLRLLRDREMYGYELVSSIAEATEGEIRLAEGVVYPMLHALAAAGALGRRKKAVEGRTRVYYRLTARGRKRLATHASDWKRITDAITTVLGKGPHGLASAT